jgi:hypothetical protein
MMNISYLVYQAERQPGSMEQREADARRGELAAAVAKAGRAVRAGVTRRGGGNRPQTPAVPGDDLIPAASSRC